MDKVHAVLHSWLLLVIALLLAADFLTGVLSAIREKRFSWGHVGDIIPKGVLAATVTLVVLVGAHIRTGTLSDVVGDGTFALFAAATAHSILSNVQELTGLKVVGYADQVVAWLTQWLQKQPSAKT